MVRKRDNRGAYTKDHRWMNLAVSKGYVVNFFGLKVFEAHSYHSRLFFFHIDEFNQTFLAASLKVPSNFVGVTAHAIGLLIEHHLDVPFSDLQLVLLYDVEWTLDATSVGEKPDFAFLKIAND